MNTPAIVAPVSRHLVVANIEKSIAYYTEMLGFTVPGNFSGKSTQHSQVVYGPAHIYFHTSEDAVDNTGTVRPLGKAILFFQTDHLTAMHAALTERGANPTTPEKVNWIKMEFFEVSDPDGHRLWYGQSYHEPYTEMHIPAGKGQLRVIMPEFPCRNVPAAVTYYHDILGFKVNYQQHDLGVMDRDKVRLLLVARTDNRQTAACCVYIENADRLYTELLGKGANIQGQPVSYPWGLRSFDILDPEGNRISFAQTFE